MGVSSAPAIFQCCMDALLQGLTCYRFSIYRIYRTGLGEAQDSWFMFESHDCCFLQPSTKNGTGIPHRRRLLYTSRFSMMLLSHWCYVTPLSTSLAQFFLMSKTHGWPAGEYVLHVAWNGCTARCLISSTAWGHFRVTSGRWFSTFTYHALPYVPQTSVCRSIHVRCLRDMTICMVYKGGSVVSSLHYSQ